MINRTVEETLLLGGMQIHSHNAVGAGSAEQIEHETRGDGLATLMLLVLTRIAEERRDHGDGTGRRTFQRVDHNQLFHNPLVDLA